jgi:hypothetical protein
MALKQNQPKVGHLRDTSINPTKRTGRSDGHEQVQPHVGHLYGTSSNPTGSGGSEISDGGPRTVVRDPQKEKAPKPRNVSASRLKKSRSDY